jgi:hypothetical protein
MSLLFRLLLALVQCFARFAYVRRRNGLGQRVICVAALCVVLLPARPAAALGPGMDVETYRYGNTIVTRTIDDNWCGAHHCFGFGVTMGGGVYVAISQPSAKLSVASRYRQAPQGIRSAMPSLKGRTRPRWLPFQCCRNLFGPVGQFRIRRVRYTRFLV